MNKYGIQVSAFTNNLEVLEAGLVHMTTPDVEFRVDNLVIRCVFETDNQGVRYQGQLEGGVLVFRFYNFANSLGEGVDSPLAIGSIKGRTLFFQFYVNTNVNASANGGSFREFKYSFMLGEANGTAG